MNHGGCDPPSDMRDPRRRGHGVHAQQPSVHGVLPACAVRSSAAPGYHRLPSLLRGEGHVATLKCYKTLLSAGARAWSSRVFKSKFENRSCIVFLNESR